MNASDDLAGVLSNAAARLRTTAIPGETAAAFERLAEQLHQPCVVAVVGRVKAGKSTFINALLGEDLAKVGTRETTATINFFRYGQPNPARPVRCHWRGGQVTDEDRAFLDSLQGNDPATLERAAGIDHLEYYLLNPYLEHVTLVDTPGTEAVVDEHQDRTAAFLGLDRQLRERHGDETREIESQADAIVYLIGATGRFSDLDLLEEFHEATRGRSRALNAVGVMAKIDLHPGVMARREELAANLAEQLGETLNVVLPVSAGLHQALARLRANERAGLAEFAAAIRQFPPDLLDKLLSNERLYLQERPDYPLAVTERLRLRGDLPWGVFTTLARAVADPERALTETEHLLRASAGFDALHAVLDGHFFRRGRFLRAYRIVSDARALLSTVRYRHLPALSRTSRENAARRARFLALIAQIHDDPAGAGELGAFVAEQLRPAPDPTPVLQELDAAFSRIFHELERYDADFAALKRMDAESAAFTTAEVDELRSLFGLYGLETADRLPPGQHMVNHAEMRQRAWMETSALDRNRVRQLVAAQAVARYGYLLDELVAGA